MPIKAALLKRTRAQRIPFRPGVRYSNKGRIHSRRLFLSSSFFACKTAADHTFRLAGHSPRTRVIVVNLCARTTRTETEARQMDAQTSDISGRRAIWIQVVITGLVLLSWLIWSTWGVFPNGLLLSGVAFLPALSLCVASIIGLNSKRMYGWISGLAADLLVSLIMLATSGWLCLIPVAAMAYLLSPQIRKTYV
jgi:hypothetical protein